MTHPDSSLYVRIYLSNDNLRWHWIVCDSARYGAVLADGHAPHYSTASMDAYEAFSKLVKP